MSRLLSYHLTGDSVSISFPNGSKRRSELIGRTDSRYNQIIECLKQLSKARTKAETSGIEQQIKDIVLRKNITGKGIQFDQGQFYLNGRAVPEQLNNVILRFEKDGLPYEYLFKFFEKLQQNPNPRSQEMLYTFLEHNGHPITDDGNFIAYRAVTEDFKDFHTGKFDNSIGAICEIKREDVDPDPLSTCSHGLHVATRDYACDFNRDGIIVEVEVDPKDVVAVPNDYNGTKMRVCKFKVIGVSENLRKETLVSTKNNVVKGYNSNYTAIEEQLEKGGLREVFSDENNTSYCSQYDDPRHDEDDYNDWEEDRDLIHWDDEDEETHEDGLWFDSIEDSVLENYSRARVPDRVRRRIKGGFVTFVEIRNKNVTIEINGTKKYRYYNVDYSTLQKLFMHLEYSLSKENTYNSKFFSFVSTDIINGGYKNKEL